MMLPSLNLPACDLRIVSAEGRETVFDPFRQKFVALTPEEWVRQHFVQFLIRERGVPAGLVAIEKAFRFQGMAVRADIVVHNRAGAPALVVECKAPEVPVSQDVFDQIARYNTVLQASHLVVTNGMVHYCCAVDWSRRTYTFLDDVPAFDGLGLAAPS